MNPSILYLVCALSVVLYTVFRAPSVTYLSQRESYQMQGFVRHHLKSTLTWPDILAWLLAVVTGVLSLLVSALATGLIGAVAGIVLMCLAFASEWRRRHQQFKVPLVWTARAKRLVTCFAVLGVAQAVVAFVLVPSLTLFSASLSVINMLLALVIMKPVEWSIQRGYKERANGRLRQLRNVQNLKVAGITGSYGKTSTKHILGAILSARYEVLITPGSFNTPMGICKVVNGDLTSRHEVFVAEMGARHRGDIRELVNLVEPEYSIITAVGPAHLETMGSLQNIAHTKFDLARGTRPGGVVVVNGDNELCRKEAQSIDRPILFYAIDNVMDADAYAKDIHIQGMVTAFTLVFRGDGEVSCTTRLLGKHNVLNIVGAALLARRMGLSMDEIRVGVGRIAPVEHRLQVIDPGTGVIVIDDAFNANPEGAKSAIEVLAQFDNRRKWVITPGLVEMGSAAFEANREFGRQMAKVCDRVVLVSKLNAAAMQAGLLDEGFPQANISVVGKLDDATAILAREGKSGDVVLFENDLPDHLEHA